MNFLKKAVDVTKKFNPAALASNVGAAIAEKGIEKVGEKKKDEEAKKKEELEKKEEEERFNGMTQFQREAAESIARERRPSEDEFKPLDEPRKQRPTFFGSIVNQFEQTALEVNSNFKEIKDTAVEGTQVIKEVKETVSSKAAAGMASVAAKVGSKEGEEKCPIANLIVNAHAKANNARNIINEQDNESSDSDGEYHINEKKRKIEEFKQKQLQLGGNGTNMKRINIKSDVHVEQIYEERIKMHQNREFKKEEYGIPETFDKDYVEKNMRVDEKQVKQCMICSRDFVKLVHKFNCKRCARTVCKLCSAQKKQLSQKHKGVERVCDLCDTVMSNYALISDCDLKYDLQCDRIDLMDHFYNQLAFRKIQTKQEIKAKQNETKKAEKKLLKARSKHIYLKDASVNMDNQNNMMRIQKTALQTEYQNVVETQEEHAPVIKPIVLQELHVKGRKSTKKKRKLPKEKELYESAYGESSIAQSHRTNSIRSEATTSAIAQQINKAVEKHNEEEESKVQTKLESTPEEVNKEANRAEIEADLDLEPVKEEKVKPKEQVSEVKTTLIQEQLQDPATEQKEDTQEEEKTSSHSSTDSEKESPKNEVISEPTDQQPDSMLKRSISSKKKKIVESDFETSSSGSD